jgi:hypothetical protein
MAPSFTTSAKLRSSQKDVLVGTSFLTVDPNLVTFTAEAWNPSTLIETNDVPFRTQSQHLLSNFLDWASFWSIGPKTFPKLKIFFPFSFKPTHATISIETSSSTSRSSITMVKQLRSISPFTRADSANYSPWNTATTQFIVSSLIAFFILPFFSVFSLGCFLISSQQPSGGSFGIGANVSLLRFILL